MEGEEIGCDVRQIALDAGQSLRVYQWYVATRGPATHRPLIASHSRRPRPGVAVSVRPSPYSALPFRYTAMVFGLAAPKLPRLRCVAQAGRAVYPVTSTSPGPTCFMMGRKVTESAPIVRVRSSKKNAPRVSRLVMYPGVGMWSSPLSVSPGKGM